MSLAERVRSTADLLPRATRAAVRPRWWWLGIVVALGATVASAVAALTVPAGPVTREGAAWWTLLIVSHVPLMLIGVFLCAGLVERIGYFAAGRAQATPGRMPDTFPLVCVQLAMFNEHQVAERVIRAAAALTWPRDRLRIQVLDDSTDDETRALVEEVVASVRSTGVDCVVIHRSDRVGYKAGALEQGRGQTDAEFLALFDADFLPPHDYLMRTIPHFFADDGSTKTELALVQTRWGHLNADESGLTAAQSLWVDDHHTLQMSWRSAAFGFVNFTGTAGVWRASAINAVGGWRAASLVEDCELSFRHLFAGYRTTFVKEIVVPSELPATYTAYKAQQKRWTQGWVQLQRLHLVTLVTRFATTPLRRLHLIYHMCISWQWPIWALWLLILPVLIYSGLWLGAADARLGLLLYTAPPAIWLAVTTVVATLETRRIDGPPFTPRSFAHRIARVAPYIVINTGMLPHQFMAFCEGLLGPLHSEFERTPKSAVISSGGAVGNQSTPSPSGGPRRRYAVKVHWPYVAAEAFFILYQLAWAIAFMNSGLWWCAAASVFVAASVMYLFFFYGDSVGRLLFVFRTPRRLGLPDQLRRRFTSVTWSMLTRPEPSKRNP